MPRFSFDDAREICLSTYRRRELEAERTRRAQADADAARVRGVAWSGLEGGGMGRPRTSTQIAADAQEACRRAEAFAASARGRLLAALRDLDADGSGAEAAAAHAAFHRGFADPHTPASPAEIARAIAAVAGVETPAARRAGLALVELMTAALALAAE